MKFNSLNNKPFQTGVSMSEYGLILGILVIVSIGAVLLLGQNIDNTLNNVSSEMSDSQLQTQLETALAKHQGKSLETMLADRGYTGERKSISFTASNGSIITIDNYPTQLSENIDTLGANGTTEIMAQVIRNMVEQMIDAGEVSNQQALTLLQLANQGYAIAQVQYTLEDMANNSPTTEHFNNYDFTSDGINYSPTEYASLTLYNPPKINTNLTPGEILSNQNEYAGTELNYFSSLYKKAQSDGSLNNPAIHSIVTHLSENIAALAFDSYRATEGASTSTDPASYNVGHGTQTTMNADGICVTGSGNVSSMSCS